MFSHSLPFFLLILQTCSAASVLLHPRQNATTPVSIVSNQSSINSSAGTANVAAAGTLEPFGGIGLGCGINWEQGVSYGGGLQAGTSMAGLGAGFTATPNGVDIGLGIGTPSLNTSTSYSVASNGSVSFTFASTGSFQCADTTIDGMKGISCTST